MVPVGRGQNAQKNAAQQSPAPLALPPRHATPRREGRQWAREGRASARAVHCSGTAGTAPQWDRRPVSAASILTAFQSSELR